MYIDCISNVIEWQSLGQVGIRVRETRRVRFIDRRGGVNKQLWISSPPLLRVGFVCNTLPVTRHPITVQRIFVEKLYVSLNQIPTNYQQGGLVKYLSHVSFAEL